MKKLLILCGPQGAGKTFLAETIASATVNETVHLRAKDDTPNYQLYNAQLIIVDDVTTEEQINHWQKRAKHVNTESGIPPLIILCTQMIPTAAKISRHFKTRVYYIFK